MASGSASGSGSTAPSSNDPPRLHLDIPIGLNQSFKRSFQQFGFDVENSPISAGGHSGLATGSGVSGNGNGGGSSSGGSVVSHGYGIQGPQQGPVNPTGMEVNGNDRNKRARSEGPQNSNMPPGFANGLRHGHGHVHGRSGLCYTLPLVSPDAQPVDDIRGNPGPTLQDSQMSPQAGGSGSNSLFAHSPPAGTSPSTPTVDSPASSAATMNRGEQTSLAPISALSLTRPDHLPEVHITNNGPTLALGESISADLDDRPSLPSLAIPALDVDFPMMDSDLLEVNEEPVSLHSEASDSPPSHFGLQPRLSEPPRIPTPEFERPLRPTAISDHSWNSYMDFDSNISALRENSSHSHPRFHPNSHTHFHTLPEHSSRFQSPSQIQPQLQTQNQARFSASTRPRLPPLSFETQRSSPEHSWIDSSLRVFRERAIQDVDANSSSILASLSPTHIHPETREPPPVRSARSLRDLEPESSLNGPMFAHSAASRRLLPPERRHTYRAPPSSHLTRLEESRPSLQEHVDSLLDSISSTPFMPPLFSPSGGADTPINNEGPGNTAVRHRDSLEDSWNAGNSRSSLRSPSPRRSQDVSGSTSNRRNSRPEHDYFNGWSPRTSLSDDEFSTDTITREQDRARRQPPWSRSSRELWAATEPNIRSSIHPTSASASTSTYTRNVLPTPVEAPVTAPPTNDPFISGLYAFREREIRAEEAISPIMPRSAPRVSWEPPNIEERPMPSSYRPFASISSRGTSGLTRHNSDSSSSRPNYLPPARHEEPQRSRPWLPPPHHIRPLVHDMANDSPPVYRRRPQPSVSGPSQLSELEEGISRDVERRVRTWERETSTPSAATSTADESLRSFQRIRIFSDMMLNDAGASDLLAFRYDDGRNDRGTRLADHLAPSFASMRGRRRVLRTSPMSRSPNEEDISVTSTSREPASTPPVRSGHPNLYDELHSALIRSSDALPSRRNNPGPSSPSHNGARPLSPPRHVPAGSPSPELPVLHDHPLFRDETSNWPARVLANELRDRINSARSRPPRRLGEPGMRVRSTASLVGEGPSASRDDTFTPFGYRDRMPRPSPGPSMSRLTPSSSTPGTRAPPRLPPLDIGGDPIPGWIDLDWLITHTRRGPESESRQGDRQTGGVSSPAPESSRPVIPEHLSHATRDRHELHNFVNRRTRVEPPRNPINNVPSRQAAPGRTQGFHEAIDILRRDGLPPTTEQRFRDAFQHEVPQATASGSSSSATPQWGDIAGDNGRTNFLNHGESVRRRRNRHAGDFFQLQRHIRLRRSPSPQRAAPSLPNSRPTRRGHPVSFSDISGFFPPFAHPTQTNLHRDLLYRYGTGQIPGFRRPLGGTGDYVRDEEFDPSYEGLLALAASLGDVKPPAVTPEYVISSLDTAFFKDWRGAESDPRCPICLDDYKDLDPVMRLNSCTHWFHKDCLEQWLRTARTCPVCRKRVRVVNPPSSAVPGPSSSQAGPSRLPISDDDAMEHDSDEDSDGDDFSWLSGDDL